AMGNAEIGENAGVVAGVGSLAGAVLGGLIGGGSGYAAGAALGEAIDRHILDNYHCIDCGYNFNSDHHQSNFTPSTYPINQSSLIDFNSHESRELNFD
ncbi:MAG: hypothetical protein KGO49_14755, partial [Gammaproteobacteria bacterium]|nr:hypothetical protein [Gammaproteobacteria bacterium]